MSNPLTEYQLVLYMEIYPQKGSDKIDMAVFLFGDCLVEISVGFSIVFPGIREPVSKENGSKP